MEKNEIVKSEIGSEAAWRGFSTQTLYIARRLLTAEDDEQLYPEQVEDLMIIKNDKIIELVQFYGNCFHIGCDLWKIHIILEREVGFLQWFHEVGKSVCHGL